MECTAKTWLPETQAVMTNVLGLELWIWEFRGNVMQVSVSFCVGLLYIRWESSGPIFQFYFHPSSDTALGSLGTKISISLVILSEGDK